MAVKKTQAFHLDFICLSIFSCLFEAYHLWRIPPQDSRIFSGHSFETSPVPLEISLSLSAANTPTETHLEHSVVWTHRLCSHRREEGERKMSGLKDVKSTPKLHCTWQKTVNNTRRNRQRVHQQGLQASLLLLSCSAGSRARREAISTPDHLCLEGATLIDRLGCSTGGDELIPTHGGPWTSSFLISNSPTLAPWAHLKM